MLVKILPVLKRITELKAELDRKGYDIRGLKYFGGIGTNGTKPYPDQVMELVQHYNQLVTNGVLLKDFDRGLIDFPALRDDGEEVYLCYLLGEPDIRYWHRIEDGFRGRQSIDTL
jgi:hypothetical protein